MLRSVFSFVELFICFVVVYCFYNKEVILIWKLKKLSYRTLASSEVIEVKEVVLLNFSKFCPTRPVLL